MRDVPEQVEDILAGDEAREFGTWRKRILVTGSREWQDADAIYLALRHAARTEADAVVIHGGAWGADRLAGAAARALGLDEEIYPARNFLSPRHRNQHMVDRGADVCLTFARSWASGTGMCARMARKAHIPVVDFGVRTK